MRAGLMSFGSSPASRIMPRARSASFTRRWRASKVDNAMLRGRPALSWRRTRPAGVRDFSIALRPSCLADWFSGAIRRRYAPLADLSTDYLEDYLADCLTLTFPRKLLREKADHEKTIT